MSEIITLDQRTSHDYGYENRLYSQVLQMQKCGIISYRLKTHEVLMMNSMAKYLYGLDENCYFTDKELLTAVGNIIFDDPEATKNKLKMLKRAGDSYSYTMWINHEDGSQLHVMATTKLIDMGTDDLIVVSSLQDISEVTQLESMTAKLEEERDFKDMVTGGYNRNGFVREAEMILECAVDPTEYAILCLDIKNFKAINEIFGRDGGDELLRFAYNELKKSILYPVVTARIQADHFACLVKKKHLDFESINHELQGRWSYNGTETHLYATVGIYNIENDSEITVSRMIERAKLANHNIVDQYLKPYSVFEPSMAHNYMDQAEILAKFENGINNSEFKVFYQPVVEAASGNIMSAEALVRWESTEKGYISPGTFIPTLEKNGHISKLDYYVIQDVFKKMRQRFELGNVIVPVSVNLSWMDFYDENMMEWIIQSLDDNEFPAGHARFEVTETSFVALENNGRNILDKLREKRALTLLDDFGSGYSSFGMLKSYNFDILKIDLSFVKALESNEKVRFIIDGIIDMCHKIGIKVVAEGAENEIQVEFLKQCGCDYIQGYYFSKPLPEEEFMKLLERYKEENRIGSLAS